jgi:hypothetical protein
VPFADLEKWVGFSTPPADCTAGKAERPSPF